MTTSASVVGTAGEYALRIYFEGRFVEVPLTPGRALLLMEGLVKVLQSEPERR